MLLSSCPKGKARYAAEVLADYVFHQEFLSLPQEVRKKLKMCVLDSIGCMVGGATIEPGRRVISLMEGFGGSKESSIIARRKKILMTNAAYANSYLANVLDYDDTYPKLGHPGASIVGTALAVGEKERVSGEKFLTAIAVGYEVCLRIGSAILGTPGRREKVHGQGNWAVFGAASTAAKLMKLDREKIADCFGMAGVHAPVPSVRKFHQPRPISWIKNNFGWAASGGIMATILTQESFTGNHTILDGPDGFWIMSSSDKCDFQLMTRDLGKKFLIEGISFKPYPSCRNTHSSLDALNRILQSNNINSENISEVVVYSSKKIRHYLDYDPRTIIDIQFSLPYLSAMTILRMNCRDWLNPENLNDAKIRKIAKKMTFYHNTAADKTFQNRGFIISSVTIKTTDGQELSNEVSEPGGSLENPLSKEFLETKFLELSEPVIGDKARKAKDLIFKLDKITDIRDVISFLAP